MAKPDIKWESKGFRQVLNSAEVASAVHSAAESVAATVRSQVTADDGVVVDDYTTDRAASSVTIRDVSGKLWEVRDGVLSRAALAEGLEVKKR